MDRNEAAAHCQQRAAIHYRDAEHARYMLTLCRGSDAMRRKWTARWTHAQRAAAHYASSARHHMGLDDAETGE